jgi:hypothetical protein
MSTSTVKICHACGNNTMSIHAEVCPVCGTTLDQPAASVRIIIAGSRGNYYSEFFGKTIKSFLKEIMERDKLRRKDIQIISGMARSGADFLAVLFAEQFKFPLKEMWAAWDKIDVPGAIIKQNAQGKEYNANAGFERNVEMAKIATHLIAFWDGKSPGTEHMISTARARGLVTVVIQLDKPRHG